MRRSLILLVISLALAGCGRAAPTAGQLVRSLPPTLSTAPTESVSASPSPSTAPAPSPSPSPSHKKSPSPSPTPSSSPKPTGPCWTSGSVTDSYLKPTIRSVDPCPAQSGRQEAVSAHASCCGSNSWSCTLYVTYPGETKEQLATMGPTDSSGDLTLRWIIPTRAGQGKANASLNCEGAIRDFSFRIG
jgi:hypothetical protein